MVVVTGSQERVALGGYDSVEVSIVTVSQGHVALVERESVALVVMDRVTVSVMTVSQ